MRAETGQKSWWELWNIVARPDHMLTHMSGFTDGPVKPDHDEQPTAAEIAIPARMGPGPVIS
jgi:hypothetical protein